ncbi:UNVERIFIED_CONTAM: hypothetical protein GTU68_030046 [Idotea baltica]|nr:hypothetical protein [Idotea baltica]
MCATKTQDLEQTLNQIEMLAKAGAGVVRVAVDSKKDVEALKVLAEKTTVPIAVDLQESYKLVEIIAPFVQKVRYNPGHLHHHERSVPVKEKVKFIVEHAKKNDCAVRIGVNFGSLDPEVSKENIDAKEVALNSVTQHVEIMDALKFNNFVVSLKSSDPNDVIDINREFAKRFEEIPIHLGVTEAGMLPMGEIKSRVAFENLLVEGIGDTLRVSLTLPYAEKFKEIEIGQKIVDDVNAGRFRSVPRFEQAGLNIISCPSCSRVENEAFIDLASKVKEMTAYAAKENVTIAVMGCRVNGPGETDDADLGLWCAPKHVNFKRKGELIGAFGYDEIIDILKVELDKIIAENK